MARDVETLLSRLSPDDALVILSRLAHGDDKIAERLESIVEDVLADVDIDDVAEAVFVDLDTIEIEEIWDRSGETRDGYVDPDEEAWEEFGQTIEPYREKMKKCQESSMDETAAAHCKGILKGVWRFLTESSTQYRELCEDAPQEFFHRVLDEWKEGCNGQRETREMGEYVKRSFPKMAK